MAQVEELGGNRVRLTVDVSPHELEHAVEHAADDLAGAVKIPGFRKGKVPRQVLLANVGRDRLWVEAVESHIGGWFWNAAARSRLRPVATPEYDFELPTSESEPWTFSATVEVQPTPDIVDWTGVTLQRNEYEPTAIVFAQGGPATSVMYVDRGAVRLSVVSHAGKEAVIAVLDAGHFFGEGCLASQPRRMAHASSAPQNMKPGVARLNAMPAVALRSDSVSHGASPTAVASGSQKRKANSSSGSSATSALKVTR